MKVLLGELVGYLYFTSSSSFFKFFFPILIRSLAPVYPEEKKDSLIWSLSSYNDHKVNIQIFKKMIV